MCDDAARAVGKACRSRQGSVAVLVALTLTMLIGFSALGTEVVFVLFKQRQMTSTASSAALAGATALMTGHPVNFAAESQAAAATAGFTNGAASVTVTVNHPPLSGIHAGNASAVEVIVGQPQTLPLSSLFVAGPWNVSGRAVALEGNSASDCVLALDTSVTTAFSMSNGAQVSLNQCGLAVNANGSSALSVIGGAILNAKSVSVSGSTNVTGGGTINATNGVKTSQSAVANPYASTVVPTASGCAAYTNKSQTLSPGTYCGLTINNGVTVSMNPGVYIIKGGTFSVQSGTLSGTGVTIALTGSGSNYAVVSIANNATVSLSAPTTGGTAGLVFFADPNSPNTSVSSFQGGAQESLTGALYFPSQTVQYSNGTSTTATCTQLIAWHMQFTGGASFNSSCANTGVGTVGGSPSQLVE